MQLKGSLLALEFPHLVFVVVAALATIINTLFQSGRKTARTLVANLREFLLLLPLCNHLRQFCS